MKKNVIVVDLDGTLYSGNTFHAFVGYILRHSFRAFDLWWFLKIVFWSGLRTAKLIPHKRWKFEILKNSKDKNIDFDVFTDKLHQSVNQFFLEEIQNYKVRILATAAPELYAEKLAGKYNFTYCSATEFHPEYSFFSENVQQAKFDSVKKILDNLSIDEIDLFITDHIDDALLIDFAQKSWIINADNELKNYIEQQNITKQIKYINVEKS